MPFENAIRSIGNRGLGVALAAALVASATDARAGDPATATMLFNEGRRLTAAGKYADACPKFEESQRLDPGIGTEFNLADCYEHVNRTASAWALFLSVASEAGGTGQLAREAVARKRAAALEPKVSKLTIAGPPDAAGVLVRRDGEPVAAILWNSPIPVDAGNHTIEASAPGKKPWSTVTAVGPNGASASIRIPPLEDAPPSTEVGSGYAPSPARGPAAEGASGAAIEGDRSPEGSDSSRAARTMRTERTVALALGGAGVAGVVIGGIFGLKSIAKHSDYEALCRGDVCSPAAGPIHDDAVTAGNVSTVAFVVGGALVAGGAVLWVMAPKMSGVAASPARRGVALGVAPLPAASLGGASVVGEF